MTKLKIKVMCFVFEALLLFIICFLDFLPNNARI